MIRFLLFLVVFFSTVVVGFSQDKPARKGQHRLDSIKVKAGHFFVIDKEAYYVSKDTIFVVPDTVQCYQKKHSLDGTDKFYNSLVDKLAKKKYSNLLYQLVFEKEEEKNQQANAQDEEHFKHSRQSYLIHEGKTINDIELKELRVFGTDVEDTTKLETSVITKTLNRLHLPTRENIIKQNLVLLEGSVIRPTELADNERLLRQLDFIKDARIYVSDDKNADHANLKVVTRDVFPLKLDYNTDEETSASSIGISNINLFGTGHENENNIVINDIGESSIGYDGYYRVKNIGGTFATGELNYVSTFRSHGYGMKIFRNFLTPEMRNAGGVEYSSKNHSQLRPFDNETNVIDTLRHKENFQDVWFSRSFKAVHIPGILKARERLRYVVGARVTKRKFLERQEVTENYNQAFHNRTDVLISAGLSSRGYYKDRLIRGFGRTEDIPIGTSLQLTLGRQFGEFFNRNYVGIEFSEGEIIKKFGYLKGTVKVGGFLRHGVLEQGIVNISGEYFSRIYTLNLFKFRQFININITEGIRRKAQDFIDINDRNGIRGLYNFFLIGTKRFVLNTESVLFTPFFIGGFRMAFLGFLDVGVINSERAKNSYYGAGFGIRLKNDNLAISTIQLRLGFYPSSPFQDANRSFSFSTIGDLGLQDFDISSPEIIEFK
jgi:hypothetical protein